jgi:excisionase family DNA binding protein
VRLPVESEIMNSREAADFLRVGKETVIREARAGRLPGRRIGKEWRFSRAALLKWLAGGPGLEDTDRYRREGTERSVLSAPIGNESGGAPS